MVLIRAVLRNDLYLRAAISAVFSVIVVGEDLDFLNGILIRRNDRASTPGDAGRTYAIDLVIVFALSRTICGNLAAVLNLEDAIRAATSPHGCSRQIPCSTSGTLGTIAESSWR